MTEKTIPHDEHADVTLSCAAAKDLARRAFLRAGLAADHAETMAEVLAMAEGDECASHGLYRAAGCIAAVKSGKVNPDARPTPLPSAGAVTIVDAAGGFAPLALSVGRPLLEQKARQHGLAALAIRNCYHFSALWADLEPVARSGLVAFSCTIGMHCVALAGGRKPALGTNPLAFAWPRGPGEHPFVFDLSTSATARGEVELRRRAGEPIPAGWAIDAQGESTTDPEAALAGALLPFGAHKGSALGIMVELLAGPLLDELDSATALAVDTGDGGPFRGGYFMLAIAPSAFGSSDKTLRAASQWLHALQRDNPTARLPSRRRYAARERTAREGVTLPASLHAELVRLSA